MIDVRNILLRSAGTPLNHAAVLLSAGIDSASVLFSLLEAGKNVTAYSFCLEGRVSKDVRYAEITAKEFGVPFVRIDLPTSIDVLREDLIDLVRFGAKKKTDFECGWPMLYAYQTIKEREIFSGMGADGHFCISKKGMMHYKNRIDEFRNTLFLNPSYAQEHIHRNLSTVYKKCWVAPYMTPDMIDAFKGSTWDEVNRPNQKQPILDAFPDQFKRIRVFKHMNFQKGDSGISEHFERLLATDLNVGNHKSVVGIYNYLVKNLSKEKDELLDI
jgi:asparagine synthetase B (glutamine-hydrolysing)